MARITVIASGTRGDVQPAIALGIALQAGGDRVRLVAGAGFAPWIRAHGIEAAPSRIDMQAVMDSPAGRAWVANGHRQLRQQRLMRQIVTQHADALIADAAEASEDADLLVSGFTSDAYALAIGERTGIPVASMPLQPTLLATHDGRAMASAPRPDRVSRLNWWFGRMILEPFPWRVYGEPVNRFRRSVGLAAQSGAAHLDARRRMPMIHAVSRHVLPLPGDWPPGCEISGYWFLDEGRSWAPPDHLLAFLDQAPAPVVVGFGSMTGGDPEGTARLVLDAVAGSGQRAILLAGWGGLGGTRLPSTVLALDQAPHDWLLPRAAAVVHHGGAGTTAAAFRAGIPQVVVPHMADQPYWGRRVRALGCGPAPVPRHRLTAATLAAAIRAAATDPRFRAGAAALSARIADERGLDLATARLRELLRGT